MDFHKDGDFEAVILVSLVVSLFFAVSFVLARLVVVAVVFGFFFSPAIISIECLIARLVSLRTL